MSLFDSFCDSALSQALSVFGEVGFTCNGKTYNGVINEHQAAKEVSMDGTVYAIDATIVAGLHQFGCCDVGKLDREFAGNVLECQGRRYRVESASLDTVSLTLMLSTEASRR